jgi:DNA-binding CsgD family transcriptional regulator
MRAPRSSAADLGAVEGNVLSIQQLIAREPTEAHRRGGWPLVGRETELSRLVAAVMAGQGAVITGPAGVGKTTLVMRSLRAATDRGMALVRTAATCTSRRLPFGMLALSVPPGRGGQSAAREAPGQLLRRYAEAVFGAAGDRRLVVFADDAHLLDEESATLLHQLALTRAATVVAAVRADAPVPDAVVGLWKDGPAERIELGPLDEAAVEELLVSALGGPVDAASARHLMRRSLGNPMALRELVTGALETGALADAGGVWSLRREPQPTGRLAELVALRLGELSEPERAVLELLALGEPLGQAIVSRLADPATVAALENKGVITSRLTGRRVQLWLAHPVYGDVVRARISALRRHTLARSLAEAIEACGARRREDPLRRASWRYVGGGGSAGLFIAGAMAARARHDHGLTERLARAAIGEGGGFAARFMAAEAAHLQGRPQQAEQELAALGTDAAGDAERARVALARFDNAYQLNGRAGLRLIDDAVGVITDPSWRQELLARRTLAIGMTTGPRAAVAAGSVVPQRLGPAPFSSAHATLAHNLIRLGRLREALELVRMAPAGGAPPEPGLPWELSPVLAHAHALIYAGRLADAEELLTAADDQPADPPGAAARVFTAASFAVLHLEQGRPMSAFRRASEHYALLRHGQATAMTTLAYAAVARALALTRRPGRAAEVLAAYDALHLPAMPVSEIEILRARAWTAAGADGLPRARSLLEAAADLGEEVGDLVGATSALHDMARLGRAGDVCGRLSALASHVEGELVSARAAYANAVAARDHALLEEVSRAFEDMGAMLYAAEARAEAAVLLRRARQPRQTTAAERQAARLLARCEGAATPAVRSITARAHLTPGELDIALQAAIGHANKQIATDMHLSVRTVESHLLRVYEKLGISRRHDLPSALA